MQGLERTLIENGPEELAKLNGIILAVDMHGNIDQINYITFIRSQNLRKGSIRTRAPVLRIDVERL